MTREPWQFDDHSGDISIRVYVDPVTNSDLIRAELYHKDELLYSWKVEEIPESMKTYLEEFAAEMIEIELSQAGA